MNLVCNNVKKLIYNYLDIKGSVKFYFFVRFIHYFNPGSPNLPKPTTGKLTMTMGL